MRVRFKYHAMLAILLICQISVCLGKEAPDPNNSSKYLKAVRTFADNVLKYGRDTYGPRHTPLFVDGLNIHTHEPVKWISPKGDWQTATETEEWILSNFASQQTLMRTLDALSEITVDTKYRQAASDAIRYAFDYLRAPNGLFYWGEVTAYDALGDEIRSYKNSQSLKVHYPYYELMWQVNPKETKRLIEAYWSAHIIDWSNLDFNRMVINIDTLDILKTPWDHEYKGGPTFFRSKITWACGFITTGTSLAHAATTLYRFSGQEQPLVWSKRLIQRFVDARHPNTGISPREYNRPQRSFVGGGMEEKFSDPRVGVFPNNPFVNPFTGVRSLYHLEDVRRHIWLSVLLMGEELGEQGKEFIQWAREELTAWGRASYRAKDNVFMPILTDGTSIEGIVLEETGAGALKGSIAEPLFADAGFFWAYATAYKTTGDTFMWQMTRDIAQGNNLGDIGETPRQTPALNRDTINSNVYNLLAFLELYNKTNQQEFLDMARRIADNIVAAKFHNGFFVPSNKHVYARFDCFEPLALLHLIAAFTSQQELMPRVWPSSPNFVAPYRYKQQGIDRRTIYTLTDIPVPSLSLQEAAAIGDVNAVKTLIESGTYIDSVEDAFKKTALHRAAISGHKDVVELLLAEGAQIDATALHYAVEYGHREITEFLIDKGVGIDMKSGRTLLFYAVEKGYKDIVESLLKGGADVNAKDERGKTALFYAVEHNLKDIVELLIAKGADINAQQDALGRTMLHEAAIKGQKEFLQLLLTQGADVNAKDSRDRTPLFLALRRGRKEVLPLLLAHGADVNADARRGITTLDLAIGSGDIEIVNILINNKVDANVILSSAIQRGANKLVGQIIGLGVDVNVKDKYGLTPLHHAAVAGNKDIVLLLLKHGVLENGASLYTKDNEGRTALHYAAGANLGKIGISNWKPAQNLNVEIVKLLIEKGFDVNAQDKYGLIPLHYATVNINKDLMLLMLNKGARVDVKDNMDRTPLHYALGAGPGLFLPENWSIDVAQLLLDNGADINAQDSIGWTPLYYLIIMGDTRGHGSIEFLIKKGADLNCADNRGGTPYLWVSAAARYHEIISSPEYQHPWAELFSEVTGLLRKLDDHNVIDAKSQKPGTKVVNPPLGVITDGVCFVATNGKDNNPGTRELPLRTLSAAVSIAKPNDIIFVRGGVYRCAETIRFDGSGEPGKPIVVKAYPGEVPTFDFSGAKNNSSYGSLAIRGAYWYLKGLVIIRGPQCGISIRGSGAHHNILERIMTYENTFSGIALERNTAYNVVLNCDSYKNFDRHWNGEDADGFAAYWSVGPGNIFIGDRAWNNADDGWDLFASGVSVRLEVCYAWNNGENIWNHPFFTGNANGFKLGRGDGRHVLIGCLAWGHGLTGAALNRNTSGVVLRDCTFWDNDTNYFFEWSGWLKEAREGCVFSNNISYNGHSRDTINPGANSQFNSWDADIGLTLTDDDFLSLDDSTMTQPRNPDGSIPQNNFLKLAPGSAAIDSGADIGMPFVGKRPDLGAFEYDPNKPSQGYVKMLHQYVRDRDIKKIKELLTQGEDINDKDWLGYTPLQWAIYFGYPDVVELLLSQGADPDIQSDTGRFALEIAKAMVYADIEALLRKHGAKE